MEKRGGDLTKEVKILQEALADYNTVLDKVPGRSLGLRYSVKQLHSIRSRSRHSSRIPALVSLLQVGSQTPVYAVNAEHGTLKERNELQRRRVDDVLTKRLQLEKRAKEVRNVPPGRLSCNVYSVPLQDTDRAYDPEGTLSDSDEPLWRYTFRRPTIRSGRCSWRWRTGSTRCPPASGSSTRT